MCRFALSGNLKAGKLVYKILLATAVEELLCDSLKLGMICGSNVQLEKEEEQESSLGQQPDKVNFDLVGLACKCSY